MFEMSAADWEQIYRFAGYGNPAGRYWFIGIEEYGGEAEKLPLLLKRDEIDDLGRVHGPEMLNFPMDGHVRTWRVMCKTIHRLEGRDDWMDAVVLRRYQAERLGRKDSETFLGDLLPIPKSSDAYWPKWMPFSDWNDYFAHVMPKRIDLFQRLFRDNKPELIFCYGRWYWPHFQKIFQAPDRVTVCDGKVQIGTANGALIILAPFFSYYQMTNRLIEELAAEIKSRGY